MTPAGLHQTLVDVQFANGPLEVARTVAAEAVHQVDTLPGVLARRGDALVHIDAAEVSRPARGADAGVRVAPVHAPGAVLAVIGGQAVVDFSLAEEAHVARHARAVEPVEAVHAGGAVQAWLGLALVDLGLAALALVALCTPAGESVDQVHAAPAVQTRCRGALVDVYSEGQ